MPDIVKKAVTAVATEATAIPKYNWITFISILRHLDPHDPQVLEVSGYQPSQHGIGSDNDVQADPGLTLAEAVLQSAPRKTGRSR